MSLPDCSARIWEKLWDSRRSDESSSAVSLWRSSGGREEWSRSGSVEDRRRSSSPRDMQYQRWRSSSVRGATFIGGRAPLKSRGIEEVG